MHPQTEHRLFRRLSALTVIMYYCVGELTQVEPRNTVDIRSDAMMQIEFADRLDESRYADDDVVVVSISTDLQDVCASYRMSYRLFSRLTLVADAYELPITSGSSCAGEPLWRLHVEGLVAELRFVQTLLDDPLLGRHITGLIDLANRMVDIPGEMHPRMEFDLGEPRAYLS